MTSIDAEIPTPPVLKQEMHDNVPNHVWQPYFSSRVLPMFINLWDVEDTIETAIKEECPVCYDNYILIELECGHRFCDLCHFKLEGFKDCIKCPLCRAFQSGYCFSMFTHKISQGLISYMQDSDEF